VNNGGRGCKISSTTKCGALAFYTTRIRRTRYWCIYRRRADPWSGYRCGLGALPQESRSPSDCNIRASFCADSSHKS
jgi:hypothetical protein